MNILKNKMQRRDFLRTLAKAGFKTTSMKMMKSKLLIMKD